MKTIVLLLLAAAVITITGSTGVAFAQEDGASSGDSFKILGAGLAFGLAAFGAGIGLGQVGAAFVKRNRGKPSITIRKRSRRRLNQSQSTV